MLDVPARESAPAEAPFADAPPRPVRRRAKPPMSTAALVVLVLALAAIAGPTMLVVARESWSTEQGAHGPLVLLTGR